MLRIIKDTDRIQLILAGIILLISLVIYIDTMAPTVSFWDCGEYIATAFTLSVPHPPGAPFYLLIGRFFTMLPMNPDIGFRVNLLSALSSALTVMFTFLIIVKFVNQWRGSLSTVNDKFVAFVAGIVGSMTLAFSDSFWFNAVEAEVYSLSTLFTAMVVWLALHWLERADERGNERYLLLIAYIMGLALGVHLLNLLTLPMIALIVYFRKSKVTPMTFAGVIGATGVAFLIIYLGILKGIPRLASFGSFSWVFVAIAILYIATYWSITSGRRVIALALMATVLVTVGYSTYTMVYVRSNANPSINENDPSNSERLVSYLNRDQYGDAPIVNRKRWKPAAAHKYTGEWDYFWNYQIKHMYVRYFNWQFIGREGVRVSWKAFYGLPFILGLFGAFHHYYRDRRQAFNVFVLFFMTGLAIILYLNQEDPQPRERDYSYTASFMAFAIWVGIGAAGLLERGAEFVKSESAKKYGAIMLSAVILFTVPINMAAKNYNSHDRSGNYVAWDYSYNILQTTEPNAIIFTNGDNDTFPLWYLQEVEGIRKDVRVINLSLLNTSWYIKQLRDNEPKVPITLTDAEIEKLGAQQWPKEGRTLALEGPPDENGETMKIRWHVRPTYTTRGINLLRVQDSMIMHILLRNKWRKPIYFAVTVSPENKIGLEDYLRMDGLAFKIDPRGAKFAEENMNEDRRGFFNIELIDPAKIEDNLVNKYRYRNLDNPDVYFNPNIQKLLQNYRSAYLQLGYKYLQDGHPEKLAGVLNSMEEVIPESVVPIRRRDARLQLGVLENTAGFPERLRARLDKLSADPRATFMDKIIYGTYYMRDLRDFKAAEEIFLELKAEEPNSGRVVGMLVTNYEWAGELDKAAGVLEDWLAMIPNDPNAQKRLDEIRALMDTSDVQEPAAE